MRANHDQSLSCRVEMSGFTKLGRRNTAMKYAPIGLDCGASCCGEESLGRGISGSSSCSIAVASSGCSILVTIVKSEVGK